MGTMPRRAATEAAGRSCCRDRQLRRSLLQLLLAATMGLVAAACSTSEGGGSDGATPPADRDGAAAAQSTMAELTAGQAACGLPVRELPPGPDPATARELRARADMAAAYAPIDDEFAGLPFNEHADQQLFLTLLPAVDAPADPRQVQVGGGNRATREWLASDGGERLRTTTTAVQDLLELIGWGQRDIRLNGLAIATSTPGIAVAATATSLQHGRLAGLLTEAIRTEVVRELDPEAFLEPGLAGLYLADSGWIVLAPEVGDVLQAAIIDPASVEWFDALTLGYFLRHELEHAVTPQPLLTHFLGDDLGDAEEGIASTIARAPGAVSEVLGALGLERHALRDGVAFDEIVERPDGYDREVAGMRTLVGLLDGDGELPLEELVALLQDWPVQHLWSAVGAALVDAGLLDAVDCAEAVQDLRQAGMDAAAIEDAARGIGLLDAAPGEGAVSRWG